MTRKTDELWSGGALAVARRLIGARLVHEQADGTVVGRIVETEAYREGDPASHSFPGPTVRNASMFLGPGHAYVYLIYGVHHCFNVVTGDAGTGEAVLVRALEPLEGDELMRARRGRSDPRQWCSGPGKLVQALDITRDHDGAFLDTGPLRIEPALARQRPRIRRATRVGITQAEDREWRFLEAGSPWVSRPA